VETYLLTYFFWLLILSESVITENPSSYTTHGPRGLFSAGGFTQI